MSQQKSQPSSSSSSSSQGQSGPPPPQRVSGITPTGPPTTNTINPIITREIKIILDNLSGCKFEYDGSWFVGSTGGFAPGTHLDGFEGSALMHFTSKNEGLGGICRYWEVLDNGGMNVNHNVMSQQLQKNLKNRKLGRQLCIAFGNPMTAQAMGLESQGTNSQQSQIIKPYNITSSQQPTQTQGAAIQQKRPILTPLQSALRKEWARAGQQAQGSPFSLLVGPVDGQDGLGIGEGMVGQSTCQWDVVAETQSTIIVRLVLHSSTDVKTRIVNQREIQQQLQGQQLQGQQSIKNKFTESVYSRAGRGLNKIQDIKEKRFGHGAHNQSSKQSSSNISPVDNFQNITARASAAEARRYSSDCSSDGWNSVGGNQQQRQDSDRTSSSLNPQSQQNRQDSDITGNFTGGYSGEIKNKNSSSAASPNAASNKDKKPLNNLKSNNPNNPNSLVQGGNQQDVNMDPNSNQDGDTENPDHDGDGDSDTQGTIKPLSKKVQMELNKLNDEMEQRYTDAMLECQKIEDSDVTNKQSQSQNKNYDIIEKLTKLDKNMKNDIILGFAICCAQRLRNDLEDLRKYEMLDVKDDEFDSAQLTSQQQQAQLGIGSQTGSNQQLYQSGGQKLSNLKLSSLSNTNNNSAPSSQKQSTQSQQQSQQFPKLTQSPKLNQSPKLTQSPKNLANQDDQYLPMLYPLGKEDDMIVIAADNENNYGNGSLTLPTGSIDSVGGVGPVADSNMSSLTGPGQQDFRNRFTNDSSQSSTNSVQNDPSLRNNQSTNVNQQSQYQINRPNTTQLTVNQNDSTSGNTRDESISDRKTNVSNAKALNKIQNSKILISEVPSPETKKNSDTSSLNADYESKNTSSSFKTKDTSMTSNNSQFTSDTNSNITLKSKLNPNLGSTDSYTSPNNSPKLQPNPNETRKNDSKKSDSTSSSDQGFVDHRTITENIKQKMDEKKKLQKDSPKNQIAGNDTPVVQVQAVTVKDDSPSNKSNSASPPRRTEKKSQFVHNEQIHALDPSNLNKHVVNRNLIPGRKTKPEQTQSGNSNNNNVKGDKDQDGQNRSTNHDSILTQQTENPFAQLVIGLAKQDRIGTIGSEVSHSSSDQENGGPGRAKNIKDSNMESSAESSISDSRVESGGPGSTVIAKNEDNVVEPVDAVRQNNTNANISESSGNRIGSSRSSSGANNTGSVNSNVNKDQDSERFSSVNSDFNDQDQIQRESAAQQQTSQQVKDSDSAFPDDCIVTSDDNQLYTDGNHQMQNTTSSVDSLSNKSSPQSESKSSKKSMSMSTSIQQDSTNLLELSNSNISPSSQTSQSQSQQYSVRDSAAESSPFSQKSQAQQSKIQGPNQQNPNPNRPPINLNRSAMGSSMAAGHGSRAPRVGAPMQSGGTLSPRTQSISPVPVRAGGKIEASPLSSNLKFNPQDRILGKDSDKEKNNSQQKKSDNTMNHLLKTQSTESKGVQGSSVQVIGTAYTPNNVKELLQTPSKTSNSKKSDSHGPGGPTQQQLTLESQQLESGGPNTTINSATDQQAFLLPDLSSFSPLTPRTQRNQIKGQCINEETVAKHKKMLQKKHIALLQALRDILDLEKQLFEPLVQVYKNCVKFDESIAFEPILMARFPDTKQRLLLMRDLLSSLLARGDLDARSRTIVIDFSEKGMSISRISLEIWESKVGKALLLQYNKNYKYQQLSDTQAKDAQQESAGSSKWLKVTGGVVAGGVLLGITGGLAAPAVSLGLSAIGSAITGAGAAVGIAGAGSALGTLGTLLAAAGPANAALLFGAGGAGLAGFKLTKRFGDLEEFVFIPIHHNVEGPGLDGGGSDSTKGFRKVTNVKCWGTFNYITRLQLWISDGSLIEYGEEQNSSSSGTEFENPLLLNADEYLTSVSGHFVDQNSMMGGSGMANSMNAAATALGMSQNNMNAKTSGSGNNIVANASNINKNSTNSINSSSSSDITNTIANNAIIPSQSTAGNKSSVASNSRDSAGSTGTTYTSGSNSNYYRNLGYSLTFTTSSGRESKFSTTGSYWQLSSASQQISLSARKGEQIVGLRFRRNRLQGIDCEPIRDIQADGSSPALQQCIFISGWLKEEIHVTEHWRQVASKHFRYSDHYALRWETHLLIKLGTVIWDYGKSVVGEQVASLWIKSTVAAVSGTAAFAITWPLWILSNLADLDNVWTMVKEKAKLAGQALAHAIAGTQLESQQGSGGKNKNSNQNLDMIAEEYGVTVVQEPKDKDSTTNDSSNKTQSSTRRPVVLVGHSMGARLIFYCLQELHQLNCFHCVQHAILLGTPCSPKGDAWDRARQVVSGRIVNGYMKTDWVLAAVYRYMELKVFSSVAGLGPVMELNEGIENFDLSDIVKSHDEYAMRMEEIMTRLKFY